LSAQARRTLSDYRQNLERLFVSGSDNNRIARLIAVTAVDGVALIMRTAPEIVGCNPGHAFILETWLQRQIDFVGYCTGQFGTGGAKSGRIDTALAVETTTLSTGYFMRIAMIPFTDGADCMAERTEFGLAMMTVRSMGVTDNVTASPIIMAVFGAEALTAEITGGATGVTARFDRQRPAVTAWAFDQTVMTMGGFVDYCIETGTYCALAGGAVDQTTLTETLPAGATGPDLGAILFTTGAAKRAGVTDIGCCAGL
jgi:hypothetical protein